MSAKIHGFSVEYPRTHQTIRCHFYFIKKGIGNYKFWTLDPRYTNDTDGIARFCRDFVNLHTEECRRYEDDKTLVLDKDNDPDRIFRPESLRVVTALENKNNTRITRRLDDGTPLAVFCRRAGVETRINGEKTKQYRRYYDYSRNHNGEVHPELRKKANDLIALYSKCLKLLKLRDEVRQFAEKIAH